MGIKLHLGCGKRYLPGWVHIDMADFPHIDYRRSVADLSCFSDGTVDEIYACHVLEHIPRHDVPKVLAEWARVLVAPSDEEIETQKGMLHLAVPDFEAQVAHYLAHGDITQIASAFVGGQKNEHDFHYYIYDFPHLKLLLENAGFSNIQRYDWREWLPDGYDDYSRSYLPHMDFENGRLMSLNVVAVRTGAKPSCDSKITLGMTQRGIL